MELRRKECWFQELEVICKDVQLYAISAIGQWREERACHNVKDGSGKYFITFGWVFSDNTGRTSDAEQGGVSSSCRLDELFRIVSKVADGNRDIVINFLLETEVKGYSDRSAR